MPKFPPFPFRALVRGHQTVIYEYHGSGFYATQGMGLVTASAIHPLEEAAAAMQAGKQAGRLTRRRSPIENLTDRDTALERSKETGAWLISTIYTAPGRQLPARQVLKLAAKEKIPLRSLRRAKKRLRVRSYKVGGKRQGWGATWYWSLA